MDTREPYYGLFAVRLERMTPWKKILDIENKIIEAGHVLVDVDRDPDDLVDIIFGKFRFPGKKKCAYAHRTLHRFHVLNEDVEKEIKHFFDSLGLDKSIHKVYLVPSVLATSDGIGYEFVTKSSDYFDKPSKKSRVAVEDRKTCVCSCHTSNECGDDA